MNSGIARRRLNPVPASYLCAIPGLTPCELLASEASVALPKRSCRPALPTAETGLLQAVCYVHLLLVEDRDLVAARGADPDGRAHVEHAGTEAEYRRIAFSAGNRGKRQIRRIDLENREAATTAAQVTLEYESCRTRCPRPAAGFFRRCLVACRRSGLQQVATMQVPAMSPSLYCKMST
jgi:hypothetical protein